MTEDCYNKILQIKGIFIYKYVFYIDKSPEFEWIVKTIKQVSNV